MSEKSRKPIAGRQQKKAGPPKKPGSVIKDRKVELTDEELNNVSGGQGKTASMEGY
jgi:bacteriocin-like protein